MLLAVAIASGCIGHCPPPSPCPDPFDVGTWCTQAQVGRPPYCTVDSQPATCRDGCTIAAGSTLTIPIAQFATMLGGHDLQLDYVGQAPESGCVTAKLDGVSGGACGTFSWSPWPTSPQELQLIWEGPQGSSVTVTLTFVDAICEANQPSVCPL